MHEITTIWGTDGALWVLYTADLDREELTDCLWRIPPEITGQEPFGEDE